MQPIPQLVFLRADHSKLTAIEDTANAILDTLQSQDDWIAFDYDSVWFGIDTTNIDTSEIGTWFSTGIAASISDANMGAIGDTVWKKVIDMDTPDYTGWVANDSAQAGWLMFYAGDSSQWATIAEQAESTRTVWGDSTPNLTEQVWYNIDTTNIDSSELGTWFSTGISASISDANMAAITDSIMQRKIRADTTDGAVADTNLADHLYSASLGGDLAAVTDTVNAILDTLQNQDGWVATVANQTLVIDTAKSR
jgi:hypothetical protein